MTTVKKINQETTKNTLYRYYFFFFTIDNVFFSIDFHLDMRIIVVSFVDPVGPAQDQPVPFVHMDQQCHSLLVRIFLFCCYSLITVKIGKYQSDIFLSGASYAKIVDRPYDTISEKYINTINDQRET